MLDTTTEVVTDSGTVQTRDDRRRPVLEAVADRPAVPHRRQPAGRLPAVPDRDGAADLRVLHRRRRHRRRRRRRLHDPRPATAWRSCPPGGGRSALLVLAMVAFAVDVQVGIPRFWTGVGIVFTIIGSLWLFEPVSGDVAAAQLAEPDRRHRRHDADVHRRHAVDDAHPVRHPDDRSRVDDRRRGCGGRRGRSRRRRQGRRRRSGGRAPTGRRRSRPASRCGSPRSTASRSRSSRSRAPPRTTASDAQVADARPAS